MKYAIIVPVYNRPEYLNRFMLSLLESFYNAQSKVGEIGIIFSDDCSTDKETIKLLKAGETHGKIIYNDVNTGIAENLKQAIDCTEADVFLCFDSDTIMTPNAVTRLIELHKRFPDDIVSGFDSRNTRHHSPIFQGTDYCIKKSIGGASMVFSKDTYLKVVRPALVSESNLNEKRKWDFIACDNARHEGKKIICATPSVVEHIGDHSALNHNVVAKAYNYACNNIFVSQPFGIGDIIFSASLIEKFNAHNVIWPVLPHFVDGCKRAYPQLNFVPRGTAQINDDRRDEHYLGDTRYIPIRWTQVIKREPYSRVMRSKYDFYGEDWKSWREVQPERDCVRERLLQDYLGIKDDEKYVLVSTRYGSDSQFSRNLNFSPEIKVIEMKTIGDFSLFDWIGIIENAEEIHAVSSSILYLAALFAKGKTFVYLRTPQEKDFSTVDYIFSEDNFIWESIE
jgi:glycosyltransferase involved in cell wall biosynthesis